MNESEMIEQAMTVALDEFDFTQVARYMRRTDWVIEDIHDDAQPGKHNWIYPGPQWLREYVRRATRDYVIKGDSSGWIGLGFDIHLGMRDGEYKLFIRFTDIRPIVVSND